MQRRHEQLSEEQQLELTLSTNSCSFSPAGGTKTVTVYLDGLILKSSDVSLLKTGNCPNSYSYSKDTGKITLKCNKNESTSTSYSGTIKVTYGGQIKTITCSQSADYEETQSVRYSNISEYGINRIVFNPDLSVDVNKAGDIYKFLRVSGNLTNASDMEVYAVYTTKTITSTMASGSSTSTQETGSWTATVSAPYVSFGYNIGAGPQIEEGLTLSVSSMSDTFDFRPTAIGVNGTFQNIQFLLIGDLTFTPTLITAAGARGSGTLSFSAQNYGNTISSTNRFGLHSVNFTC